MAIRIEIHPHTTVAAKDARGEILRSRYAKSFPTQNIRVVDCYTIDGPLTETQARQLADALTCRVTHAPYITPFDKQPDTHFDHAIEIGFLPGVTDNIATTVRDMARDLFGNIPVEVYSSRLLLVEGKIDAQAFAARQSNPLIQRTHLKTHTQWKTDGGMDIILPRVKLSALPEATEVNLQLSDAELEQIGTKGIANPDGTRRGPLGLSLDYLKAIRDYFHQTEGRPARDIELETLAQTWSEHCKHTIFASSLDEVTEGIYRHYIRRATEDIRKRRGNSDICVSVFKDNAGAISFDENWLITDKVETHNSPSALDPFGGAITGIVGVNRDALGFGLGSRPVANRYGFCFADPRQTRALFRDPNQKQPMLQAEIIMEGVVRGVEAGGNCSGIPTPQGFTYFDERYAGKPLVFVGTIGLIPRELGGKPSHVKQARPGDLIVMLGGRVGKDGIHGATFSSVALDEGSPSTAVQIGDPITQKKFSDAIVREARHLNLYSAITDNGAGGLSSSVGEMAEGSGGFHVELEKVPLKYPGMAPWEIWISESQERMTLAIPPENFPAFQALMQRHGAEATAIGTFTDSGRAVISWEGHTLMDMSMHFLHEGNPPKFLKSTPMPSLGAPVTLPDITSIAAPLNAMLSRLNICSRDFITTQYDHEVQANSVLKPVQGKGRISADASVIRPVLTSQKGAVLSQGLLPRYSDLDCYHMAAASIDLAVRHAVAAGVSLDHLALLDNFCWCDAENPQRLHQLKQAALACYEVATAYGTPFISGKDSMFNDFKGFDANGKPIMISAPPTLLISGLGVIDDITQSVSLDAKLPGDVIYLLGETRDELGGSEYYAMHDVLGEQAPTLDTTKTEPLYRAYHQAVTQNLVASAIALGLGGLGAALAKTLIGGQLGADITLPKSLRRDATLFSESTGRLLVTVAPQQASAFEAAMQGHSLTRLGTTTDAPTLHIDGEAIPLATLTQAYHAPLKDY